MFRLCLGAAAFALSTDASVAQGLVTADPDVILLEMQKAGFLVTRDTADDGTPRLNSKVSGISFRVYFYGCEEATNPCTSVQFSAGYDLDNPLSALKINEWNSDYRYVRTYIDDEGDPYIKFDLWLDGDGMGRGNFAENLDIWRSQVESFEDFIDW